MEPFAGGEVEYIEDEEVKLSVKNLLSDSSTLISLFHDITGSAEVPARFAGALGNLLGFDSVYSAYQDEKVEFNW